MTVETAYGTIHLTPERYEEFISIVGKHTNALMLELKEHNIAIGHLSLEKTSVGEYEQLSKLDELTQSNNIEQQKKTGIDWFKLTNEEESKLYNEALEKLPIETQKACEDLFLNESVALLEKLRALGVTPAFVMLGSGTFGSLHLTSELVKKEMAEFEQLHGKV